MLHEDIDPLKATSNHKVNLGQGLYEMTQDIDGTLKEKLQPIYSDLYKNRGDVAAHVLK